MNSTDALNNLEIRRAIRNGSKSFFLASWFFSGKVRNSAWILYRWCRHCDDAIDKGGDLTTVDSLRKLTRSGLDSLSGPREFSDLGRIVQTHNIPRALPFDLLLGFEMDARGATIVSQSDLESYAYHVAGVVGVMMSYLMGARFPQATTPAICLGNAMQLTNIARDVSEDFQNGRVYLPSQWLADQGLTRDNFFEETHRDRLFKVVTRLLFRAEELYQLGYQGLSSLPFRSAIAVSIAGSIYSAIGKKILNRGPSGIAERAVVSLPEKCGLILVGVFRVLASRFHRWPGGRSDASVV